MCFVQNEPTLSSAGDADQSDIDASTLHRLKQRIDDDPARGMAHFSVETAWQGKLRSETKILSWCLGGEEKCRTFSITADLPYDLLGADTAPNPQELLLAALNSCLIVSYILEAVASGVLIEYLSINAQGAIDLRGALGICENVRPGLESIHYTIRIKANGTKKQLAEIHDRVLQHSPNAYSVTRRLLLTGDLEIID